MADPFVIVGAGLAGATAAQTLREQGFTGPLVIVGAEPERPYERPPLSKGYLTGQQDRESVFVHPADWYEQHDVELQTGVRVLAIDPGTHTVTTAGGSLRYAKLLLATGSTPRTLPVPGAELVGVHCLRTLADAGRLAPLLVRDAPVVVIGGGWIGLELAAAARTAGAPVTVVETAAMPLQRVLGRDVAQVFVDLHQANGVRILAGRAVQALHGGGHVEAVELTDGTMLPAALVVVGVGVLPNVELAVDAGLDIRHGVVTDEALRTSHPDVYAAGDIAEFHHRLLDRSLRVEHWANARTSGATAARAMLGQSVAHDSVPYFFTDQYDLGMEYRGHAEPGSYDRVVFRGSPRITDAGTTPSFVALWTRDARVVAAMNVNSWDDGEQLERLVRAGLSGQPADLDRLADPTAALPTLPEG